VITAMPRPRPPYLHREKTRHGSFVWIVRRDHGRRIRLRAEFGTQEFWAEYRGALEGTSAQISKPQAKPQTVGWALGRYRNSSAWTNDLAPATRRQRENIYRQVVTSAGCEPLIAIDQAAIREGRERRSAHPHSANNFLKAMRGFFAWCIEEKLITENPTVGVKLLRGANDEIGHHTWTEDEVRRFELAWPVGTRERLALDLMLYTGLSRGDVVRLGKQHVRDGVITLRTEKERGDGIVVLPMLPILAETVAASPTGDLTFIVTERGKSFSKESFGNWFRKACIRAGVPGRAHGLRKAGATRAADNGASERQLMALFNWSTSKMAVKYTRAANKKRLAADAAELLLPAQTRNEKRPHRGSGEGGMSNKITKTGR
jgi:integrase